jgi:hypothetical protein
MSSDRWIWRRGDEQVASNSLNDLQSWARSGKIQPSDYVWNPILQKWMYARESEELRPFLGQQATEAQTKPCPFCGRQVPAVATKCPECFSDIGKHEMLTSKVCFVATVVYGDEDHIDVRLLREWRNRTLVPSRIGRALIRVYWIVGPAAARSAQRSKVLKSMATRAIASFVAMLRSLDRD